MRKLYEATGGRPQRWESLDNLGAVKADAAGIAYAIERDWLIISGGAHSVSLTEAGRRIVTPANFLNRNDSQAQVARWKCPATAMF